MFLSTFHGPNLKIEGEKKYLCDPLFSSKSCRWGLSYWSVLKKQVLLFFRLHCLLMLEFLLSFLVTQVFSLSGAPHENYQALWFERCEDRITGEQVHIYKGGYWEAKDRGSFEGCPDIFWPRDWLRSAPKRLIHQHCLVDSSHEGRLFLPTWTAASLQRLSVLRDLHDGHYCLIQRRGRVFPLASLTTILLSHIWEDWNNEGLHCFDSSQAEHDGEEMKQAVLPNLK